MRQEQQIESINKFWFGQVEQTIIPSERRAKLWFGEDPALDTDIRAQYERDLQNAIMGKYREWQEDPRGQLALIVLLDQFSRHIYRNHPSAYKQDYQALEVCLAGIGREDEHQLSLIERVFFYFPLLHSERLAYQEESMRAYQMLSELAFSETKVVYDSFLKFANHHYNIIQRFGRFPQRNELLGRESTPEEIIFLKELEQAK